MKNRRFLDHFIQNNRRLPELEQCMHTVYFKNRCGQYLAANDNMVRIVQLEHHQQLLQHRDSELITHSDTLSRISQNDKCIKQEQQTKVFIEYGIIGSTPVSALSMKTPLLENDTIIGVFGISLYMNDIQSADFFSLERLMQYYFESDTPLLKPKQSRNIPPQLSSRESECLQLYIHGYSASQIAHQFRLSTRTVESYLSNVKAKLGVNTRQELISKSLHLYPELLQSSRKF